MACQDGQLCDRLKAVINGVVHQVQAIWDENSTREDWRFLLVDTRNVFKNINQIGMLWKVRHLWPYEDRFVFNCYCHWSSIFLRNVNETASFLHSREGVMQGEPL